MNNEQNNIPVTPMQRVKQVYPKSKAFEECHATDKNKQVWVIRENGPESRGLGHNGTANGAWKNAADNLPNVVTHNMPDGSELHMPGPLAPIERGAEPSQTREVAPNFTVSGMSEAEGDDIVARLEAQAIVNRRQDIVNAGYNYGTPYERNGLWNLDLHVNGEHRITVIRPTEGGCWHAAPETIRLHEEFLQAQAAKEAAAKEAATAALPDINGSVTFDDNLYQPAATQRQHGFAAVARSVGRVNGVSKLMSDSIQHEPHTPSRQLKRKASRAGAGYERDTRTGTIYRK